MSTIELYDADLGAYILSALPSGDGAFSFADVKAGNYRVKFQTGSSGGITTWYGGETVESSKLINVTSGQAITGINATLARGASISGQLTVPPGSGDKFLSTRFAVVSAETGVEVPDGHINFGGNGTNVYEYWIPGIPAGSYKLHFDGQSSGAADQWYDGVSSAAAAKTITLAAGQDVRGIDVVLQSGGKIRGKVTLNRTGF
ncbi:hypothetical protein ACRQ5B_09085 [Pseudarthrobacter sp. L19]|uniref:hypothetical protein n=1 Tax=Pseudarthrobacter sp. L19 TaxID=3423951 RepID=UPI003D797A68